MRKMFGPDVILIILALGATLAATIRDFQTREVPDWISYGLIIAGFGVRLLGSLSSRPWSYFFSAFIGLGMMYILGSLMYYTKQWGGGDAKLLMGLGVVFATRPAFFPQTIMPFLGIVLINIFIFGAIYGLVWGVMLAWKRRKKFVESAKELLRQKVMIKTRIGAAIGAIIFFSGSLMIPDLFIRVGIMAFALIILLYPYLWIYVKSVEKACLYKHVPPSKLTEGDWVEEDIIVNKKIIYKRKNTGVEKEDIQRIIRAKVRKVLVKEGIPFTISFFLGVLATLLQVQVIAFI